MGQFVTILRCKPNNAPVDRVHLVARVSDTGIRIARFSNRGQALVTEAEWRRGDFTEPGDWRPINNASTVPPPPWVPYAGKEHLRL